MQVDREGAGQAPSTVSSELESHRFEATPKPRRDEHIDASTGLSSPRLSGQCSATTAATTANAYGVEDMPIDGLGLTPGLIRAGTRRGGGRCPAGLSLRQNGIDGPTVQLSPRKGVGRERSVITGQIETHHHRSFNWEASATTA